MERRGLSKNVILVDKEGEPLERETFHYGRTSRGSRHPRKGGATDAGETRPIETETRPKGEAGAEVSVLRVV